MPEQCGNMKKHERHEKIAPQSYAGTMPELCRNAWKMWFLADSGDSDWCTEIALARRVFERSRSRDSVERERRDEQIRFFCCVEPIFSILGAVFSPTFARPQIISQESHCVNAPGWTSYHGRPAPRNIKNTKNT